MSVWRPATPDQGFDTADRLAFGSRRGRRHHKYPDLDIAINSPDKIPFAKPSALEEAFAHSDLPFRVDIVDLKQALPGFRRLVEATHVHL